MSRHSWIMVSPCLWIFLHVFIFVFISPTVKSIFLLYLVVVLRVPSFTGSMVHVPLTCGEAFQNEPVFWKKNGNAAFNSIHFTYVKKKSKSQELSFACLLYSSSSFCFYDHIVTMNMSVSQVRSSILLCRGTKSRSWWRRWKEGTTLATSVQVENTWTTLWS